MNNTLPKKRILFVAEAVTLAHVARPAALLQALDPQQYEVFFASEPRVRRFVTVPDSNFIALASLPAERFADRLRRGMPLYRAVELESQVAADRVLLERLRPDLVVGDFRLSLSVSARLAGVRYAAISNAYWSPWAGDLSLPLPVLPWTPYVPLALGRLGFRLAQRAVLAPHCSPLNRVRRDHALPALPAQIRRIYTDADDTLYADSPVLFPTPGAPASHRHIGPVLWSPPVDDPPWWDELDPARPTVYVTMGSSGSADLLGLVFDALAEQDVQVLASTAGAEIAPPRHANVRVASYLPGEKAAARSILVICNGGAPTTQQALAAGVPVLGICANMDQMLNMRGLEAARLGFMLRVDRLSAGRLRDAARELMARGRPSAPDDGLLETARSFNRFVEDALDMRRVEQHASEQSGLQSRRPLVRQGPSF